MKITAFNEKLEIILIIIYSNIKPRNYLWNAIEKKTQFLIQQFLNTAIIKIVIHFEIKNEILLI